MSIFERQTRLRTAIAIACVLASSAAYLIFSLAIRAETEGAYRRLLWSSFLSQPHGPLIEPIRIAAGGAAVFVIFMILVIVTGVLTRRAVRSQERDAGPEIIVYSLAAVVVPVLIIAAAGWPDGRGWLTNEILLIATGALCAGTALLARKATGSTAPVEALPWSATSFFGVAFAVVTFVFATVLTVVALSSLRGFDTLAYHLPMSASWLRHSRLTTNVEDAVTFFFPGNAELFGRWMLTMGTDRLTFVPSLLAAAGCCYAVYKIGLEIGQSREAALIAGCSVSSCVLLAFVATTAYIDAFMALTLLLATLFLLRARKKAAGDNAQIIAFGTALGLAIGSKYSALQPALILGLLWLLHVARRHWRRYEGCLQFLDFRALLRDVVPFAIPIVLCSAYWYIRNAVEHGNPLYPFAMLGMRGLPNAALIYVPEVASPIDWLLYPWREMSSRPFDEYLGGVFAGVALVGLLAAAVRRGQNQNRDRVVLITVASFAFWLITGNFVPRYGIFPILLTFVFVGDLWMEYRSKVLRLTTFTILAVTLFVFGRALVTEAVYVAIQGRPRYGVPLLVDTLPSARLLNATPSMANYYLMGRDYRHTVITTFSKAGPDDLIRFRPDYVLLRREDVDTFRSKAALDLVASSEPGDPAPADLYRVTPRYGPPRK